MLFTILASIAVYKIFTITLRAILWKYRKTLDPAGHFWL